MCFFFFKQKTAYEMRISDWSSDVCSSDLVIIDPVHLRDPRIGARGQQRVGEGGGRRLRPARRNDDAGQKRRREQRDRSPDASIIWLVEAADRTRRPFLAGDLHLMSSSDRKSKRLNSSH